MTAAAYPLLSAQQQAVRALRQWHLSDGEDVTVFEGFSLGRLSATDVGIPLVRQFHRAALGLDPDSPEFLEDGYDEKYAPFPDLSLGWRREDWKARAFRLFYRLARPRRSPADGRSALVIGATANRMLWEYWRGHEPGSNLRLDFALRYPPGLLNGVKAVLGGSRVFDPAPSSLTDTQKRRLSEIGGALESLILRPAWRKLFYFNGKDLSGHFRREQLAGFLGRLEALAVKCAAFDRELSNDRPDVILIPDEGSPTMRLLAAVARKHGVPTWLLAHGFPAGGYSSDEVIDAGEFDSDRILAWGPLDRDNLRRIGVPDEKIEIVGFPAFDAFLPLKAARPLRSVKGATALVVAYCSPLDTTRYLEESEEKLFVEAARALDRLEAKEILFKVHPGLAKTDFYRRLAARLSLRCPIRFFKGEPFLDVLSMADFAVGPVSTAVFEVLLSGRDYFILQSDPNDVPPPFELDNLFVAKDSRELERNLAELRPVPRDRVLRDHCGIEGREQPWHFTRRLFERLAAA